MRRRRGLLQACEPMRGFRTREGERQMLFHEAGREGAPVIVLLHGGGLSDWSWRHALAQLAEDYRIVTPVIEGHGAACGEPFVSIADSAAQLVKYIDARWNGHVAALGGVSLGAQIAIAALAQRGDIAGCALLESALVERIPGRSMIGPMCRMSAGLIRRRWFAALQARELGIPKDMFEDYFADTRRMTIDSLVRVLESNADFSLPPDLPRSLPAAIMVGERERRIMRRSARRLHEAMPGSALYVLPGMKHGELSLAHPDAYARIVRETLRRA